MNRCKEIVGWLNLQAVKMGNHSETSAKDIKRVLFMGVVQVINTLIPGGKTKKTKHSVMNVNMSKVLKKNGHYSGTFE